MGSVEDHIILETRLTLAHRYGRVGRTYEAQMALAPYIGRYEKRDIADLLRLWDEYNQLQEFVLEMKSAGVVGSMQDFTEMFFAQRM